MEFASGSGSGSEADGQDRSGLTVDQIRQMITMEVLQILQEELFGIVDWIPGMLISKFEECNATL